MLKFICFFQRFTISTWIFILEPCTNGLCSILNHRSTELLTPLLSITSAGEYINDKVIRGEALRKPMSLTGTGWKWFKKFKPFYYRKRQRSGR